MTHRPLDNQLVGWAEERSPTIKTNRNPPKL